MLPLSAIMIALSYPIVRVIYERYAFKVEDSILVGSVLMASSLGMFVYLGRDVLVRVFYALGDGGTPFKISVVNIFLNALFDFLLWKPLGAPGLVLATVGVNVVSCIALLWCLDRRLNGLPWHSFTPLISLAAASIVSGLATWGVSLGWQRAIPTSNYLTTANSCCWRYWIGSICINCQSTETTRSRYLRQSAAAEIIEALDR
jgi:putative peptidoglycan lipid II flippase